jgi:hypothetical protein
VILFLSSLFFRQRGIQKIGGTSVGSAIFGGCVAIVVTLL